MSANKQKRNTGRSAGSVKKVAKRAVKSSMGRASRARRFVKSHPVGILVGASAVGLAVATLKRFV